MDRELARKATILLYANRVIGKMFRLPKVNYSGNFDCKAVADSIPIPKTALVPDHQACWKQLFQKFDRVWWEQEQ